MSKTDRRHPDYTGSSHYHDKPRGTPRHSGHPDGSPSRSSTSGHTSYPEPGHYTLPQSSHHSGYPESRRPPPTKRPKSREMEAEADPYEPNVFKVKQINKRSMGMVMIKRCGNEGNDDTPEQREMRTLLQGAISYYEKYANKQLEKKWENAELKIYGNCETLIIRAGNCRNKYVVQMNGRNEVFCTQAHQGGGCSVS